VQNRLPHQLQFDDWVPFPVPRVFAFFCNPENLPRIMPAAADTRLERLQLVPPPPSPVPTRFPNRFPAVSTIDQTASGRQCANTLV
jgi:hypothetical protein